MFVIRANNVNDAWPLALDLVAARGEWQDTRAGRALVVPEPVTIVYERPTERVLFDPIRDHNPFFALMESLWMLAGRDDATWLDQFVSDFSARFAEPDGHQHGAYGRRWRDWFKWNGIEGLDQLDEIVRLLRANPQDRQTVIQMWDPSADLGVPGLKDRPCNLTIAVRADRGVLDITVFNRSNDLVLGAMGANVVHMSILQEYLAAHIGIPVGIYRQVANNLHMYQWTMEKVSYESARTRADDVYPGTRPLVDDPESFDAELRQFMADPRRDSKGYRNRVFADASLMIVANDCRRDKMYLEAIRWAECVQAPDWRQACVAWLERRLKD